MNQTIVEYIREESVKDLQKLQAFKNAWPIWEREISKRISPVNAAKVLDLGNDISEIFTKTGDGDRGQSAVSNAGVAWEALICWYLNFCLIGTRTVVMKNKKLLVPSPVREAITVSYGSIPTNTESDLIAITFPDKPEYMSVDKFGVSVRGSDGNIVNTAKPRGRFNYMPVIDAMLDRDFNDCEISIIQCKTNWNENAQIPMLWDMVYASNGFRTKTAITVGGSGFSISTLKSFTYCFVTVPTSRGPFEIDSMPVNRVKNLSGGNYWGQKTVSGVANSLKDIFVKNFSSSSPKGIRVTLSTELSKLRNVYAYFGI